MSDEPDYVEALVSRVPVVVRRRVLWSECDPARVVYTGRFFDYLSAAYAWFLRSVLNQGDTLAAAGLGTPMKAVSIEFHGMLWPDDWFEMTVCVVAIRTRTFDLQVAARSDVGKPVFTGTLSPIIATDATKTSCPIPQPFRDKLERYRLLTASRES